MPVTAHVHAQSYLIAKKNKQTRCTHAHRQTKRASKLSAKRHDHTCSLHGYFIIETGTCTNE